MAEPSRYNVDGDEVLLPQGVLPNKLHLTDPQQLDEAETILLADAYAHFFHLAAKQPLHCDVNLLFEIHRFFLGTLYAWAGRTRSVDISKDGMLFASVKYLDHAVVELNRVIQEHIPAATDSLDDIALKLAVIHNDCNAVHPFREGNGRTIRLFLDLLAASVGLSPIDWSKSSQNGYISACIKGVNKDHVLMQQIILKGLIRTE